MTWWEEFPTVFFVVAIGALIAFSILIGLFHKDKETMPLVWTVLLTSGLALVFGAITYYQTYNYDDVYFTPDYEWSWALYYTGLVLIIFSIDLLVYHTLKKKQHPPDSEHHKKQDHHLIIGIVGIVVGALLVASGTYHAYYVSSTRQKDLQQLQYSRHQLPVGTAQKARKLLFGKQGRFNIFQKEGRQKIGSS